MNWLDIVLLVLIGLSFISGLMKGLVREVFSLGGVILAILAAMLLAPTGSEILTQWLPATAAYAAALLIIFLVVMVAVEFLSRILTKLIKFVQLGFVNHLLGGFFGILRGVLIGVILLLGLALFLDAAHPVLVKSEVAPYLSWGARGLSSFLPNDIRQVFNERLDELDAAREGESA